LARPLEIIIQKLNLNLNGRHIGYACDDLTSMLIGKARELKSQFGISDQEWEKLSGEEKIKRTNAKIDLRLVATTLANKSSNDRSALIAKEDEKKNTDANHRLYRSILKTANDLVAQRGEAKPEDIIQDLHRNYNLAG
jgi:hypothetical protein